MPPVVAPVIVPAAIMGVVLLVSWGTWSRQHRFKHGHWGGAVGLAAAYLCAHVLLKSWPNLPPERADDWQAWLVLPLAAIGIAQRWWGTKWFVAIPVRAVVCGGVIALLLRSQIEFSWDGPELWAWLGGLVVAASLFWHSLENLAEKRGGASMPLSLWALCALSAGVFALSGSAFFAQLAGALAGAFGAAVVLAWWSPGIALSGGTLSLFAPLYCGIVARGYFHAEVPVYSAALMYLALFALWWGEERRVKFQRPWKGALIRMSLVSAPLAVALVLAYWFVFRSAGNSGYAY
jgi:hypothetical protein